MRDPEEPLRTAYFLALRDKISLNGAIVPVFATAVPEGTPAPYVCISEMTVAEEPARGGCSFWDCSVLVDVVTKSDTKLLRGSDASRIGAIVMDLVKGANISQTINSHLYVEVDDLNDLFYFLPLADFENLHYNWAIFSHRLELSQTLLESTNTSLVNRRLLRFRDRLEEMESTPSAPPVEQGGFILLESGFKIKLN